MPKRVPLQSVVVFRDKKPVTPLINEPFDFTEEEVADIERLNPGAITAMAEQDLSKAEKKAKVKDDPKADGSL